MRRRWIEVGVDIYGGRWRWGWIEVEVDRGGGG